MAIMDVSPEEMVVLLGAVRAASIESRRVKEETDRMNAAAAEARRAAIAAALDAGIPREDIAAAASVNRNLLYRLAGRGSKR
ncbi:hypothetical protein [Nocardia asiatica]|uniref:hypothetical protein n=1 Tax=Nocardia asiatica TaxID=209252 RepID=UPI0024565C93|nr:hypothetical protein [Nocardia asiatica]